MNKNIFIVNPTAGNGKSTKFIHKLEMYAKEENEEADLIILKTKEKGYATVMADTWSNAFPDSIIYSVGGDGTLNEIVNGINPNTKLSIIPSGSGNDFYRVFKEIKGTKKIDLGVVNNRKFINIASLGIDAKMADRANQIKKDSKIKVLSYPRAIIEEIIKYTPIELNINNEDSLCSIFTLCNGKYYGSGFPMNPNYDLNDGFLNIITAGKLSRREIIVLLLKILKEKHLESDKVLFMKANNIIVESNDKMLCNVDGEIFEDTKFEFKVLKDGLTLTTDVPQYVKRAIKTIK